MKHKNIKIALSVFLTAFAFGLNITGISPVLGVLNTKYHAYGTSMVQMLQTLPYPVSYTHLDVYKRQSDSRAVWCFQNDSS